MPWEKLVKSHVSHNSSSLGLSNSWNFSYAMSLSQAIAEFSLSKECLKWSLRHNLFWNGFKYLLASNWWYGWIRARTSSTRKHEDRKESHLLQDCSVWVSPSAQLNLSLTTSLRAAHRSAVAMLDNPTRRRKCSLMTWSGNWHSHSPISSDEFYHVLLARPWTWVSEWVVPEIWAFKNQGKL